MPKKPTTGQCVTSNSGTAAQAFDPLVEINKASTGTLLSREAEKNRLETGTEHIV